MLNGVVQPVNDAANERSSQTLQPYQALWLAHWKRTCSDAAGDTACPRASQSEGDYIARTDGLTKGAEVSSRSTHGVGSIKSTTSEIGNNFMNIGRKSVGNDRMISYVDGRDADALFRLNPLKERFLESSSPISTENFKFGTNKGKAVLPGDSRQTSVSDTDLLCERKVQSDLSSDECLRESVSCDHCLSMINRASFLKMQKCSGIRLSPGRSNSSEDIVTTKSHSDCYSKLKLQRSDHNLGTMRICTSVDVPGGERAGFPRFSQTNTDLLITKYTDLNAFKENETFRSMTGITRVNRDLHNISSFFGQNKQLKALSSLDVKASKVNIRNGLSAETDMETDFFEEKKFKKFLHSASNIEPNDVVSSRKVGQRRLDNELPDINLELPNADAGNRWVKRLKLSSSNSSSIKGATSPNYASITPCDRTSKLFSGIPRSSTTRSKPDLRKHHDERSVVTDKSEDLLKIDEYHYFKNPNDKAKTLLLSHTWIQRWLHSGGREMKRGSEIEATCNPISSKLAVEKLEKEQVPGIAAMALMAKVLTCVQQCELQKKGSYTIWNTKTVG